MSAKKNLLSAFAVGMFALTIAAAPSFAQSSTPATQPAGGEKDHHNNKDKAQNHKKDGEKKKEGEKAKDAGAKVGEAAPAFSLKNLDGKDVSLADYKGKIVVLEWFNPECPFIVKHHKTNTTFNDLYTKYSGKDVVFLAINSGAAGKQGNGKEVNTKAKTDFKIAYPILLDESGTVGKAYGAKTTPHCFVIGKDGKLAYQGAIDDDKSPETAGKTNYVAKAVDELLANTNVTTPETRPYGCAVKY